MDRRHNLRAKREDEPMQSSGATAAEPPANQPPPAGVRLPLHQLVTLSIYWFGIQTIWGGLNIIVIPGRLDDLSRDTAGTLTAILFFVGAIAPLIIQPTVGVISDYTVTRWGRRKPYIVTGAVLDVVFLAGLAFSNDFVAMVAFYFLLQVSSNFAQGPFQGYVPDLVPAEQVGTASGLMGLMLTLGTIGGVGIATLGGFVEAPALAVIALGVVELATMIVLVATVREGRSAPTRTMSWTRIGLSAWGRDILGERDVLWLLLVRLLFLGAYNATLVAVGYFRRSHGLSVDDANTTVLIATAIVGVSTALAALPGGRLSDRFGRRPVIWTASAIAAFGLAAVAVAPTPELAVVSWVPFGIGMGIFLSADWALMADVIPKHTSGRYMGILNAGTAMAGPAFIIVAGPLQDLVAATISDPLGPRVAMGVGALFVVFAAIALLKVNPARREFPVSAPEPVRAA
jgi:MFS family permease